MLTLTECPVCGAGNFKPFLSCKDHTVSQETFDIVECLSCSFRFTNPIPDPNKLGDYYKAEAYVSHTSSGKGLINFLYLRIRKFTLKQKIKWLKNRTSGKDLLDVGCGTGHFAQAIKAAGFDVTGIEPDPDARQFAIEKNQVNALDKKEFYVLNKQYDAITLWHVLEHLSELNKDIGYIGKWLKPDGTLFIAVPNCNSFDARLYRELWAGYDVPRHLYHFTEPVIKQLFQKHGLKLVEILPQKFDAYYVSMLSEKHKKGSVIKGFRNGLRSNLKAGNYGYSSQVYVFKKG